VKEESKEGRSHEKIGVDEICLLKSRNALEIAG
jgi:hypothetical protein